MKKQINEVARLQKIAGILNENYKGAPQVSNGLSAYALVIDEDGDFVMKDLATYAEESYIEADSNELIPAKRITGYPTSVDAWKHSPQNAESEQSEWEQAVAKLGRSYNYYDVIGDGGENVVVAAVPKGKLPSDYVSAAEEDDDDY